MTTLENILEKKKALDASRPINAEILKSLEKWYDVELTYSSNAIEGNTLTRSETAIVLEKGVTVRGKPLKDHVEIVDAADALSYIKVPVKCKHLATGSLATKGLNTPLTPTCA